MQFDKPGCYGFASTYSVRSQVCQVCDHKDSCSLIARENLTKLSEALNVDSLVSLMHEEAVKRKAAKREEKIKLSTPTFSEAAMALISELPNHSARVAKALLATGSNHRKNLLAGVNSMKGCKPMTMEVLFDLLIKGPVTRVAYIEALKEKFKYTDGTASSQASIGFAAVLKLGIILEKDGCFVVRGSK